MRRWLRQHRHAVAQALSVRQLFHVDLNFQRIGRFDQDLRFGQENLKDAFLLVQLLEGSGYDGPRHFDASPPRRGRGWRLGLRKGLHATYSHPRREGQVVCILIVVLSGRQSLRPARPNRTRSTAGTYSAAAAQALGRRSSMSSPLRHVATQMERLDQWWLNTCSASRNYGRPETMQEQGLGDPSSPLLEELCRPRRRHIRD